MYQFLACLGLFFLPHTFAAPATDPTSMAPKSSATGLTRRQVYNCDADWMKAIEAQAWADAGALADVAFKWNPGGRWQPAMDLYMGKNSVEDPYKGQVVVGIQNERDVHHPNSILPEAVISVYCGDSKTVDGRLRGTICKKYSKGKTLYPYASSWVRRGTFYNDYYIVLCPKFFAQKDSLMHTLAKMNTGAIDKNNGSAYKFTWAHTYYHELMHLDPVVAEHETWDDAYGACNVTKLAASNGCKSGPFDPSPTDTSSLRNADSWAFFASAAYFQEALKLGSPGRPDCNISAFDADNPESYWDKTSDRANEAFSAKNPPPADPSAKPFPDGPTPALPFDPKAATPSGLATPYTDAIAFFSSLGAATPSPVSSAASPRPPPPYATGTCHIHVKEYQDCEDMAHNLYAVVNMHDAAGNDIGDTPVDANHPIGNPVDAANPYSFTSKLAHPLVITGEHQNDYVQFTLGSLSWTTKDTSGPAYCKKGDWDPKNGPICAGRFNRNAMSQMDCWFPC